MSVRNLPALAVGEVQAECEKLSFQRIIEA
jgi:hypothetical protein